MNTKIEELQKIQELFDKMSDEDKNKLNGLLLARKEEYAAEPLGTVRKCLQEMTRQKIKEFTNYVNNQIDESQPEDYARSIGDSHRVERGKAFVEAMSSQARANQELIQQRRDARYEEMVNEANENSNTTGRSR